MTVAITAANKGPVQPPLSGGPPAPSSSAVLLDVMAYQRTFDGAYMRTALNELSYSLVILKLFDQRFYFVGLTTTVLAMGIAIAAIHRSRLGRENAKRMGEGTAVHVGSQAAGGDESQTDRRILSRMLHLSAHTQTSNPASVVPLDPADRDDENRLHGVSHFKTAGNVVAFATLGAFCVELAILIIILTL